MAKLNFGPYFSCTAPERTLAFHWWPHFDEIFSSWQIKQKGNGRFRLAEKCQFWRDSTQTPDGRSWEDWAADGFIMLGCAVGSPLDEHPSYGDEGKQGECTASLTAKMLDLDTFNDDRLRGILDYAIENDTKGGASAFEIANLIKAAYRSGQDQRKVIQWAHHAINAVYYAGKEERLDVTFEMAATAWLILKFDPQRQVFRQLKGRFFRSDWKSKVDWWKSVCDQVGSDKGQDVIKRVSKRLRIDRSYELRNTLRYLQQSYDADECCMFLRPIVTCMRYNPRAKADDIFYWTFKALDARYYEDEQFQEMIRFIQKSQKKIITSVSLYGRKTYICAAETGSCKFSPAARSGVGYPKADILIQKMPNGGCCIFINKLTMTDVKGADSALLRTVRQLRFAEAVEQDRPTPSKKVLEAEGVADGHLEWYFHKPMMAVLNGSETAPDHPKTVLTLEEILEIVSNSFNQKNGVST